MLARTLRREADLWMQTNQPEEAEPLYLEAENVYRQTGEESALDLAHTLPGPRSDQGGEGRDKRGQIILARGLRDLCTP